jgi:hypothetical protein
MRILTSSLFLPQNEHCRFSFLGILKRFFGNRAKIVNGQEEKRALFKSP